MQQKHIEQAFCSHQHRHTSLLWVSLHRSCSPLDIQQLPFPGKLHLVLVNPKFEAPTKQMRAALPKHVPLSSSVKNCSQGASLVSCPCTFGTCTFWPAQNFYAYKSLAVRVGILVLLLLLAMNKGNHTAKNGLHSQQGAVQT